MMLEHLHRMVRYNQWANRRLLEACRGLDRSAWGLTEEQKEKLNVKTRKTVAVELSPEAAE